MDIGRFRRGRFIGSGASGDVFEGVDTSTGEIVAIKCVDCRRFRSIAELEAAQAEAALLSALRHRHIVRLHAVHFHPTALHFVMEYASGGTLARLLSSREGRRLDEAEVLRIFAQIFQAVEFCHRRCVVHRDLKPENILLDSQGNVKVADFGLASILTPFDGDVASLVGTPEFMAPDLLVSSSCDGAKADVWSLGVMLFEALAGRTPFSGPNLPAILRAALRGDRPPLPPEMGPDCRDLVDALLQPDPSRRIPLEEVLEHPWVRPALDQGPPTLLPLSDCSEEEAQAGRAGSDGAGAALDVPDGEALPERGSLELGFGALGVSSPRSPAAASRQGSCRSAGSGAHLCRSTPASLDLTRPLQRASSLALVLPGMEEGQQEGEQETGGHLPTMAAKSSSRLASPQAAGSSREVALGRCASLAVGCHGSCRPAAGLRGGSRQPAPRSPHVHQQLGGKPLASKLPPLPARPAVAAGDGGLNSPCRPWQATLRQG
ncbi:hypothetical protein ABPG75_007280 [Micractinium tetrahymenae]